MINYKNKFNYKWRLIKHQKKYLKKKMKIQL